MSLSSFSFLIRVVSSLTSFSVVGLKIVSLSLFWLEPKVTLAVNVSVPAAATGRVVIVVVVGMIMVVDVIVVGVFIVVFLIFSSFLSVPRGID